MALPDAVSPPAGAFSDSFLQSAASCFVGAKTFALFLHILAPPKNLGDSGESGVASEGCRGERRKGQNADEMEKLEGTFFGSGPK